MAQGDQGTRPMNFQVPEEMRNMAERSVTQTRQALESFLQAARRTAETMEQTTDKVQASSKDMAQKTLSAVEQNLRTSLDYAERLVPAKDLQEAAQIQSEFVRTQAEVIQTRMREFGSAMQPPWGTAKQTGAAAGRIPREQPEPEAARANPARQALRSQEPKSPILAYKARLFCQKLKCGRQVTRSTQGSATVLQA